MGNQTFDKTLQFGNDKYLITKRLYRELIAETNYISDYNECRIYVMKAMNKCMNEIKRVANFEGKKIDFEI